MSVNQTTSKRRWLWLIPVVLLIAGLLVFFTWWQYFTTTPGYSLALLVDAAQKDDRAAFDSLLDVDQVIDNFISQSAQNSALDLPATLVTSVRTQLQSLAPEAMDAIREGVRTEIRNRINELAGSSRPFVVNALAISFRAEINQNGGLAKVKINNPGQVELVMLRLESEWRVTSLRDQELAARVVNGIVKELPRLGSPLDQQIRELPETLRKLPLLNAQ